VEGGVVMGIVIGIGVAFAISLVLILSSFGVSLSSLTPG
jgi:hypothetical protein